jgi:hypothetical protein
MKDPCAVYVKCPYYLREKQQRIICEGLGPGTSIHLVFGNQDDLKDYKQSYCMKCWQQCHLTKMQNRRYEYDV